MTEDNIPLRFDIVAAALRTLGISLRSLPDEYEVNIRGGGERTARIVENLGEALAAGRAMAVARAAAEATAPRPKRRRKKTVKQLRKRFIRRHNKGVRRRAIRRQRSKP